MTQETGKGHTMTVKKMRALKKELLELDSELKRVKAEILAARIKQLAQEIHRPASGSRARKHEMLVL
ncbi:MAG: hypothetical protein ACYTFQ_03000 [Planctomycetota bacterium]